MFKIKRQEYEVVIYNAKEGGIIGGYKTFVLPSVGDNFGAGQVYQNSPNYIIQKRVLLTDTFNKNRIIVHVIDLNKLDNQPAYIKDILIPFL